LIDEVLITFFKSPNSYTGEDSVEINCHGSVYIKQQIIELLLRNGARIANQGEYTLRAFMNGKLDLSQAEAVADLIATNSKASHDLAINHMRGGFSSKIKELRTQLLDFASLIELELDFSEEDVEFANRDKFNELLSVLKIEIERLTDSFSYGNVLKNGIPIAIIGKPNVGKSTLLNALLNEDRAIVSEIPGTTRDIIEDTININGIPFRFIDTAGLRHSNDEIENLGIEKTYEKINQATIILYLVDLSVTSVDEIKDTISDFRSKINDPSKKLILIANKIDLIEETPKSFTSLDEFETIFISAKRKVNIQLITDSLLKSVNAGTINGDNIIVSNARHYEALKNALLAINNTSVLLTNNSSTDLLAFEVRSALNALAEITGEVSSEEILNNVFSRFCIGK
jgi:tRNA modification GTPase